MVQMELYLSTTCVWIAGLKTLKANLVYNFG
jgi:hypothetical protein